jgi:hypothetical protein
LIPAGMILLSMRTDFIERLKRNMSQFGLRDPLSAVLVCRLLLPSPGPNYPLVCLIFHAGTSLQMR